MALLLGNCWRPASSSTPPRGFENPTLTRTMLLARRDGCQRKKPGLIDNATATVNRPSRYRYALPREGMVTETEPAQGCNTAIGFTLVLPVIDARLHCLALPGAACNMLDIVVPSWNRTGTLRLPMAWAFFSALSPRHARMHCANGPSQAGSPRRRFLCNRPHGDRTSETLALHYPCPP